jgi:heme-degrading monooxygenase HmoA
MTIARIWRTRIDESRAADYQRFANERSLPMFRAHAGFLGVLFGGAGDERVVISFWRDTEAVRTLEQSPRYRETVREIEAGSFILGPSSVEVYAVHGGALDEPIV